VIAAVVWLIPSVGMACSMCADAQIRVSMPGFLDAKWTILAFVVASLILMVFGRMRQDKWRLGSVLYWLSVPAGLGGALLVGNAGLSIAAGLVVAAVSVLRCRRFFQLEEPSLRERFATILGVLFVFATPMVVLLGNQRVNQPAYLVQQLFSYHHLAAQHAFELLIEMDGVDVEACEQLASLTAQEATNETVSPMAWFGLMTLADQGDSCPELVQAVQTRCAFRADAAMDRSLECGDSVVD